MLKRMGQIYGEIFTMALSWSRLLSLKCATEADNTQVALKQRGIDKLLEEAREDNKENDAIHLSRK